MTSYTINGVKGFCGEPIIIKVWNNGTSFKCDNFKDFKKSVVIWKVFSNPEKKVEYLCDRCSRRKRKNE